jgi:class 3 adenylate cyclase
VEDLGLTIRAGLHTGELEMADGDVHGIGVHIAARIMALAAPGDVLVSGVIPPLVLALGSRSPTAAVTNTRACPTVGPSSR